MTKCNYRKYVHCQIINANLDRNRKSEEKRAFRDNDGRVLTTPSIHPCCLFLVILVASVPGLTIKLAGARGVVLWSLAKRKK